MPQTCGYSSIDLEVENQARESGSELTTVSTEEATSQVDSSISLGIAPDALVRSLGRAFQDDGLKQSICGLECLSRATRHAPEPVQLGLIPDIQRRDSGSWYDDAISGETRQSRQDLARLLRAIEDCQHRPKDVTLKRGLPSQTDSNSMLESQSDSRTRTRCESIASSTSSGDTELDTDVGAQSKDTVILSWAPTVIEEDRVSIDRRSGVARSDMLGEMQHMGMPEQSHSTLKSSNPGQARCVSAANTIDTLLGLGRTPTAIALDNLLWFDDTNLGDIVRGFVQYPPAHDDASGVDVEEALNSDWRVMQ